VYNGALKIVSALIPIIRKADFDLVIKDTNIEAERLYSGALDIINITLWAVRGEGETLEDLEQVGGYDGTTVVGTDEVREHTNMEKWLWQYPLYKSLMYY
jgi:hypothetical protein